MHELKPLVFGGSGALGKAVCRRIASHADRFAFTYCTNKPAADQLLAEHPGAKGFQLDLTSVAAIDSIIDQAAEALGGINAFIQCAAIGVTPGDPVSAEAHQRMDDVSESGWDHLIAVNVKGAFFACRRIASHLRRAGGGNIVMLGSIDGIKPLPAPIPYAASKAALAGMVQAMAKELGRDNIRVNLVAPGVLEAGLSRTLPQKLREDYVKHCGTKRVGTLDEVAHVVTWLACENTYVTGQTIVVDGAL